ncbi:MAG TPA: hypothetical protein PLZ51_14245, partial [Aggregatilineales bacterium]|nr:hypothetical protein [Aggregatilineales bacterium]
MVHLGGDIEDYEAKHIPSALFTTVGQLNNPNDEITGQIGTPEQVATALGNLGILATDTIILYDTSNNLSAARAYW